MDKRKLVTVQVKVSQKKSVQRFYFFSNRALFKFCYLSSLIFGKPSYSHNPARTSPGEAPPPASKIGGDDNDSKFTIGAGLIFS